METDKLNEEKNRLNSQRNAAKLKKYTQNLSNWANGTESKWNNPWNVRFFSCSKITIRRHKRSRHTSTPMSWTRHNDGESERDRAAYNLNVNHNFVVVVILVYFFQVQVQLVVHQRFIIYHLCSASISLSCILSPSIWLCISVTKATTCLDRNNLNSYSALLP